MRPGISASGPGREVVAGCEGLGGVEDGKGHGDHGEDDETAAEVYASEDELGYSDSGFCLLYSVSIFTIKDEVARVVPNLSLAPSQSTLRASPRLALPGMLG